MDAIATITISLIAIGLSALTAWRLGREPKRPDPMNQPFGDYPNLNGTFHARPFNSGAQQDHD